MRAMGFPALVVLAALVCAGCGAAGDSRSPAAPAAGQTTTRALQAAPAPDPASPDGVAVVAIREIYTWYPATEAAGASLARARQWLGPTLIRILDAPTVTEAIPTSGVQASQAPVLSAPKTSVQWARWAAAGAHVEAFTFASGQRAPLADHTDRQQYKIGIEQTVVYPDRHREGLPPTAVIATVVDTSEGWRLDDIR